ncbi:Polysaccharide biosynthesis protein, partial [Hespellia stercorisuis DSM 15480]
MKQNSENKYYQLVFNIFLFALGNIGSKFLVFFLMPLYTNELTTTEYGISELVLTGTNLLIPFLSISIQDATLRFALDKKNVSGEVLKNTVFILTIGTVLTIALNPIIGKYRAISEWSNYFITITIVYMIRNALSVYLKSIDKTKLFAVDS